MPGWKSPRFAILGGMALLVGACSSYDARFRLITTPDNKIELNADTIDAVLGQLSADSDRPIVLFVHGRGNEPEKSIARNALASIEARHGVHAIMFNWDSFCLTCRPVDRAADAAPDLVFMLKAVAESRRNGNAGSNKLILLTHSMGSIVLQHAVADSRFDELPDGMFDAIVLASSDSDADGHAEWMERLSRLAPATYVTVNPRDWILGLSGRDRRLGNRVPNGERAGPPVHYIVAASEDLTLHRLFNNGNLAGCGNLSRIIDAAIKGDAITLENRTYVEKSDENVFHVKCAA
ncbi:MAG: alpha/beta hydrolase [Rhodospirillales bacterium]|nr:alpha/beta hydrolase [Rhodospirillales bacterium]